MNQTTSISTVHIGSLTSVSYILEISRLLKKLKRWDNILNEIYALLQQQLSSGDMGSLKEVQIGWIKDKESSAKNAASKYADDEMKEITKNKITKERCYELVKNYMK